MKTKNVSNFLKSNLERVLNNYDEKELNDLLNNIQKYISKLPKKEMVIPID